MNSGSPVFTNCGGTGCPPGPASTGTATMFAVPYWTQIARPKSDPMTRYEPASGSRLHLPLRGQLGQRRHHRLTRLRPEERPEIGGQPRPHQRPRHDLGHALPGHRALVETEHALRPERDCSSSSAIASGGIGSAGGICGSGARTGAGRAGPSATWCNSPWCVSRCCMPCWRLA